MADSSLIHRSLAWVVLIAWAIFSVDLILSDRVAGWGVQATVTCNQDGVARLYYDTGSGFSEEQASSLAVEAGRPQRLRFSLPQTPLLQLRFDPIDGEGSGTIEDLSLVGPLGQWSGERSSLRFKPGLDIDDWEQKERTIRFNSNGLDPQFYVSFKPKPQEFPSTASMWMRLSMALLAAALTLLVIRLRGKYLRQNPGSLFVVCLSTWLFGMYLYPQRVLPEAWFWLMVAVPAAIEALLNPLAALQILKSLLGSWPGRCFAAMLSYWALRSLSLDPHGEPARGLVLTDLLVIGSLAVILGLCMRPGSKQPARIAALLATMLFVLASWQAVDVIIDHYRTLPLNQRLQPGNADIWFPLYRTNSGTACFGLLIVAWLSAGGLMRRLPVQERPLLRRVAVTASVLFCIPLLCYLVLSQSRSAILALLVAGGFIAAAARQRPVKFAALAVVVLTALLAFGSLGERLEIWRSGDAVTIEPAVEPVAANDANPPAAAAPETHGMFRQAVVRPAIWRTYLAKSAERWLLGHGFGGEQTLTVEMPENAFEEDMLHLHDLSWNPHCLHLSALYFGGVIGLLLHVGTLSLVWISLLAAHRKTGAWVPLATAAALMFGCCQLSFESTLMAYDKEAVLLRLPNEFWMLFWLPLSLGVGWLAARTAQRSACPADDETSPATPAR